MESSDKLWQSVDVLLAFAILEGLVSSGFVPRRLPNQPAEIDWFAGLVGQIGLPGEPEHFDHALALGLLGELGI